jgi:hypothetical protein
VRGFHLLGFLRPLGIFHLAFETVHLLPGMVELAPGK